MAFASGLNIASMGRIKTFGRMIKFSHSIFALPFALVAAIIATDMHTDGGGRLSAYRLLLLVLAIVFARTAAMGFNRIVDMAIDARNPRTARRELPSGQMSRRSAIGITGLAAIAFVGTSFLLGTACGLLAPPVLAVLLGYSYTKRFTWACHFVLGASLGLAPLATWYALVGSVGPVPLWLALGVLTWVAGFDILYSLSDMAFDRSEGLHSVPARFGVSASLVISTLLHVVTLVCLLMVATTAKLGIPYGVGVALVGALLAYEHAILKPTDLSRINTAFFTLNGLVSVVLLISTIVDRQLR